MTASAPPPPPPVDDNSLIAERRAKLAAIRGRGIAFPNDFKPRTAPPSWRASTATSRTRRSSRSSRRLGRRPADAQARHGQGQLRDPAGRERPDPAARQPSMRSARTATSSSSTSTSATSSAPRAAVQDPHRRALGPGPTLRLLTKSLRPLPDKFHGMADAEQKYRHRYVDLITDEAARARFVGAQQDAVVDPPLHGRARLHGGRDADAPSDPGRRQRQALRDPSQRARPADVPAHRARALPEAPDRRRLRAGVRDQPELSQRRHLGPPQPRVHDDGVLRGVLEPPRPDGLHRGSPAPRRARGGGLGEAELRRPRGRPRREVRAHDGEGVARPPRRPERRRGRSMPSALRAKLRPWTSRPPRTGSCPSCSSACSRRRSRPSSGSRPSSSTIRPRSRRWPAPPTPTLR